MADDRALRKLLQLGLVEKWENDVAVKSTWRMIADPVELSCRRLEGPT